MATTANAQPEMAGPEAIDAYLDLLVEVRKHFMRFRKWHDNRQWMDRREVIHLFVDTHVAWSKTVEFLAAELGMESRVTGMWRPDWPNVTWEPIGGEVLTPEQMQENDAKADRFITGVYESVLVALKEQGLETDDDYLQWEIEDFADRLWERAPEESREH